MDNDFRLFNQNSAVLRKIAAMLEEDAKTAGEIMHASVEGAVAEPPTPDIMNAIYQQTGK